MAEPEQDCGVRRARPVRFGKAGKIWLLFE
jgi:hypothetical protein